MREDLQMKSKAMALGYGITGDSARGESLSFIKGSVRIWQIRGGWQCADLVQEGNDSFYRNHRPYKNLEDALEDEA